MILSSIHADLAPKRHRSENSTAECDVMCGELQVNKTFSMRKLVVYRI